MISYSLRHFPQIRFRDNQKHLWNPVLRKAYKQRPEERVRLQFVDFLINEAGFSKNKIAFESPVSLPGDKSSSRSDIICYGEAFQPLLLVECKAPNIQLDEQTAIQIARYNTEINARFLMVTNGMRDFWFVPEEAKVHIMETPPEMFTSTKKPERDFEYWQERGFAGLIHEPTIRDWLTFNCVQLFVRSTNPVRFFPFEGSDPNLHLPNFYRVVLINEQTRLAVSFTSTPEQETRINAVLNQGGRNIGVLSASMDLIAKGDAQNTVIQNGNGNRIIDLVKELGFDFRKSIKELAVPISNLIMG